MAWDLDTSHASHESHQWVILCIYIFLYFWLLYLNYPNQTGSQKPRKLHSGMTCFLCRRLLSLKAWQSDGVGVITFVYCGWAGSGWGNSFDHWTGLWLNATWSNQSGPQASARAKVISSRYTNTDLIVFCMQYVVLVWYSLNIYIYIYNDYDHVWCQIGNMRRPEQKCCTCKHLGKDNIVFSKII